VTSPEDAATPGSLRLLSIVIPALNEEGAISSTLRRCIDARDELIGRGGFEDVEVIVVNDGSKDRTEARALLFPEVTVLGFDRNRGYGAALQTGFAHARGDALAFLDADGTCDPRVFADLGRALRERRADLVLGSRMGRGNRMPVIRRIGNTAFAWLLGVLSKRRIGDTASGMRVMRRSAYAQLLPLPDGMHFTPAMSARALLEGRLTLVEIPIPYAERVGSSKLSVLSDGMRFLGSILQATLCYRPARLLLLAAGMMALGTVALAALPAASYLRTGALEDWMIYRVLLATLLGSMSGMCVSAAVVSERIAAATHGRSFASGGVTAAIARLYGQRLRWLVWLLLGGGALALVAPGLAEFLARGTVHLHWSRPVLALLLVVLAAAHALSTVLLGMIDLMERQTAPRQEPRAPDRVRPARS
jgi:hypothetical protein